MSEEDDLGRAAEAYWKRIGNIGDSKATSDPSKTRAPKRKTERPNMPEDSDPTDPLALIVQALRENADAIQAMEAEFKAARLAMAETERKMSLQADTNSAEMRSLILAVQNLTVSQARLERLKSDRYIWVLGGVMIGAALASFALTELPLMWRQIFG